MRASVIAIGIGVAGLVGFGVWLGRSSSTTTANAEVHAAPAPEPGPIATPARTTTHGRPAAPSLARRAAAADPGLAADLAASDPKIRRAAVREVARSSDPDPAVMLAASRDPDPEVGATAMVALAKLYADGQVPLKELAARATDHAINERVRSHALNGIGAIENPDAAGVLAELLARGDVLERRAAAALLVNQDMTLAVPALIRALGDADEYVRSNALDSLKTRSRGRDFGTNAGAWQAWWQSRQP